MRVIHTIQALGPIDIKNIRRDPLLKWIIVLPLLVAVLSRSLLQILLQQASIVINFNLLPYYRPLMAYTLIILTPMLTGMVIGFLLLDQRDDHTLIALQVTPLTLNGYLIYRLLTPTLVSMAVTFIALPISGLVSLSLLELTGVALSGSLLSCLYALFIAAFAANKVQGSAITKITGSVLLPPLAAFFIPAGWRVIFGIVPTYWPGMLLWGLMDSQPLAWINLPVGLVYQGLLLWLLLKRYNHVMKR